MSGLAREAAARAVDAAAAADERPDRLPGAGEPDAAPTSFPIAPRVIAWQRAHGRHDLPWQGSRDAYRIWVSEVMLQQTQVGAAVPFYERFMARFPDVHALARAEADEVMRHWSGLGYYSRARNLHACARQVVTVHGGAFPSAPAELERLPGIGRSTAAAIAAFAFGARAAILDGNVKRVLARVFGIEGFPGERQVERRLWAAAEAALPSPAALQADAEAMASYTQGMMDLGATICVRVRPHCGACPLAAACVARQQGRTTRIPAPRPRRVLPQRHAAMLIVRRAGRVLVERRPPTGIWGGLWSLPQADAAGDAQDIERAVAQRLGAVSIASVEPLAPFEHGFTHFRLQARPWLVELAATDDDGPLAEEGLRWLAPDAIEAAGLPRPIKRLLHALAAPSLLPAA